MAGSGGGNNGTSSYLVAVRGCWLLAEDHLGEIFSPRHTTHRWWVTSGCNWGMSSRKGV